MIKPVIKKQTHYSVLLMRDDSKARNYRVKCGTLHACLWAFVILLLAGAGGVAGGLYFWQEYSTLARTNAEQEKELAEIRLQLERLSNLESLLAASNGSVPQAKHEEVGASPPPDVTSRNATSMTDSAPAPAAQTPPATNATSADSPASDIFAAAGNATAQAAASGIDAAPQTNSTTAEGPAVEGEQAAGEKTAPVGSEGCPLRIAGFSARVTGQQRLRISYELSTTAQEGYRTYSGAARYEAVFENGSRLELPLQDTDGARFSIARMKIMQTTIRLPEGYRMADIDTINVYLSVSGGSEYHAAYPLSR